MKITASQLRKGQKFKLDRHRSGVALKVDGAFVTVLSPYQSIYSLENDEVVMIESGRKWPKRVGLRDCYKR